MKMMRRTVLALSIGILPFGFVGGAFAESTEVNVSIWDKGNAAMEAMDAAEPMGMAMMADDKMAEAMKTALMGLKVDMTEVPAGDVTFNVTNDSTVMVHEMMVLPVADVTKQLPYDADKKQVDEEKAGTIGEVEETDPGKSGTVTLKLEPGTYMLFCNMPGHYMMGLWTMITVKG